jgi:CRISPR-associated helicase Cas3/CRISPR-associated endonuclease Cas3-HD
MTQIWRTHGCGRPRRHRYCVIPDEHTNVLDDSVNPDAGMPLSDAALSVWAKTNSRGQFGMDGERLDTDRKRLEWLPLHQHLKDAGEAAAKIWDDWLSDTSREVMSESMRGDTPAERDVFGRATAVFLAAAHDVGKATPCFAVMYDDLTSVMRDNGLTMSPTLLNDVEKRRTFMHAFAGHVALSDWLDENDWDFEASSRSWLGYVIGGHHGRHGTLNINEAAATDELNGDQAWADVREEHLDRALYLSGLTLDDILWLSKNPPAQVAQVLFSATTVYADWFASTPDLFPLYPWKRHASLPPALNRTNHKRQTFAWNALGSLPETWKPDLAGCETADTMYASRFGGKRGMHARPVQQRAFDTAHECDPASLIIIEAPMGEGKTEAGLMAAEILAKRSGAGGLLFALPTQATTDKMFERILTWIDTTDASLAASERPYEKQSISLVHGGAQYNQTYQSLELPGEPECVAADDHTKASGAFSHVWLNRKKATMSNFVVATIDQLLLLALAQKNLPMRHLGVAGKVVVIDEAHAYDAYMNRYLNVVLEYLGAYNVPVVMLSATLPVHTRQDFIDAYVRGQSGSPDRNEGVQTALDIVPMYPAVSWFSQHGKGLVKAQAISPKVTVSIRRWNEDDVVLGQRLEKLLVKDGKPSGRALVIRNTVKGAQETYEILKRRFGSDVLLTHARFTNGDRQSRDAILNKQFGHTNSRDKRRRIVVSTQVVEQSLDVDFDILISDVSPTDVLFQRMGRIHRHRGRDGHRPDALTTPVTVLRHANWYSDKIVALGESGTKSSFVYDDMLIYRAILQFKSRRTVTLPKDISRLVHEAYLWEVDGYVPVDDPLGKKNPKYAGTLKWAWLKARQERAEAKGRAGAFLMDTPVERSDFSSLAMFEGVPFNEADGLVLDASVRDSVMPTEVILLEERAGRFYLPEFSTAPKKLKKTPIDLGQPVDDERMRGEILRCSIRVPAHVIARDRKGVLLVGEQFHEGWSDAKNAKELSGRPVVWLDGNKNPVLRYLDYSSEVGLLTNNSFKPGK